MEYKTPMVAKKLGVSTKVVMRMVNQLQLDLQKNKFGHYIFTEDEVQQLMVFHQNLEQEEALSPVVTIGAQEEIAASIPIVPIAGEWKDIQKQLTLLTDRVMHNERKLQSKADEVAHYQLLQHRKEIEELQQTVRILQMKIERLETEKQPAPLKEIITEKKRKKMILSIFGF